MNFVLGTLSEIELLVVAMNKVCGSSPGMVGMFAVVLVFWWENRKGMNL